MSQNTTASRIHFDPPGSVSARSAEGVTHLVRGVAGSALDTLVEGFSAAEHLRTLAGVQAPSDAISTDLLLERLPFGEEAARELRQVGEDLLRHVLGREGALSEDALQARTEALRSAVRRALEEGGKSADALRQQKSERIRLLADVAGLLRELGLEHFDVDVALAVTRGGELTLTAAPVTAVAAHVRLLERLLGRLEVSILGHELLRLEREASSWWFRKWSVEPPEEAAFARRVREQEWSLAERGTLYMGPVLDNYLGRGFAARLPPRQQKLAHALQASFPGVFVVRDRRELTAIFQDVETGRRIEVHEHAADMAYAPGWIGLGRLYAFDGPLHLRSPGMALLETDDEPLALRLGEALRRGRRQLAPALALETLVSALTREGKLPRPVPPARSPTEARLRAELATHALAAVGLVEDSEETPEPGAAAGNAAKPTRRYKVDATVGQWLGELLDLAGQTPKPGQSRAKVGAKKGKRGGR